MVVTDFATLVSGGTAKPAPIPLLLLFGVFAPALGHRFGSCRSCSWWFGGGGSAHHPVATKGLPKGYSSLPQGWAGTGLGAQQEVLTMMIFYCKNHSCI